MFLVFLAAANPPVADVTPQDQEKVSVLVTWLKWFKLYVKIIFFNLKNPPKE